MQNVFILFLIKHGIKLSNVDTQSTNQKKTRRISIVLTLLVIIRSS